MKERFQFQKCMEMMRSRDPQMQEEGFHWMSPHAAEHLSELIQEFEQEESHGLRCWLLELIGASMSPEAVEFLATQLRSTDPRFRFWAIRGLNEIGTREARTHLWEARTLTFATPEETEEFRSNLDAVWKKIKEDG